MPKINAKDSKIYFKRCKFERVILNLKIKILKFKLRCAARWMFKKSRNEPTFKIIILYKSFSSKIEADFCWFFALSVRNYGDACRTPPPPPSSPQNPRPTWAPIRPLSTWHFGEAHWICRQSSNYASHYYTSSAAKFEKVRPKSNLSRRLVLWLPFFSLRNGERGSSPRILHAFWTSGEIAQAPGSNNR